MGELKQRDYMFDTFRGLLILSIPMSHFTKMAGNQYGAMYLTGGFPEESLFGFVYITINVFVMQAFMFLSGYFSKKVDRAQETAFGTFMWPYLVFTVIYYFIRMFFMDGANLKLLTPPFALWFLFVLFFYRFFLKYMVKFNWLLPVSIMLYLLAGQVEEFGNLLALGRALSYFPFFLLGYYCSKERLAWFQGLRKKPLLLALLGIVLVGITFLLMHSDVKVGWYLLKQSVDNFSNMMWWEDTLMRILIFFVASGWIIFMVNIIPSKKSFISYIGMNTMPVYVFHLTLRYVVEFYGIYVGFISCLVVAWFAILSLIHKKHGHSAVYGVIIALSIIGFYLMYSSGILTPLYGLVPENIYLMYVLVYGGALICGVSFVAPFWVKLYDLLVTGPVKGSKLATWLQK
ncbi:MAG: hypothetical protein Q4B18_06995 [Bacillota bacterium]|nr:hypothetical protein [Bacillota bacterium]